MGVYNDFPQTNYYNQDLGWLIHAYKNLDDKYNILVTIYEKIKENIKDVTLNQLEIWLNDGTFENLLNQVLLNKKVQFYTTTKALQKDNEVPTGVFIETLGFNNINDNGAGLFFITEIKPDTPYLTLKNNKFAMFIKKNKYSLYAFGYDTDSDITNDFYKIATWFANNSIEMIIDKNYKVDLTRGLIVPSSLKMTGDGTHKLYGDTPYNLTHYNVLKIKQVHDIYLKNLVIDGAKDGNLSKTGEWGHCIGIYDSLNIHVDNCQLYNAFGDGIELGSQEDVGIEPTVYINECVIYNCRRQGISILSGSDIVVKNTTITGIEGTEPQSCIDIEPYFDTQKLGNITLENLKLYDSGYGLLLQNRTTTTILNKTNINIKNIDIDNCTTGICVRYFQNENYMKCNLNVENVTINKVYGSSLLFDNNNINTLNCNVKNVNIIDSSYKYGDLNIGKPVVVYSNTLNDITNYKIGGIFFDNVNIYYSNASNSPQRHFVFYVGIENTNYSFKNIYIKTNTNKIYGWLHLVESSVDSPRLNIKDTNYTLKEDVYSSNFMIDNNATITLQTPTLMFSECGLPINLTFFGDTNTLYGYQNIYPRTNEIGLYGSTITGSRSGIELRYDYNGFQVLNLFGNFTKKDSE